jgi:hypothetical protein
MPEVKSWKEILEISRLIVYLSNERGGLAMSLSHLNVNL